MIRNPEILREWEDEYLRREPVDFWRNLRVFEALWEEARLLGILPLKDPLEGLEDTLDLARKLHAGRVAASPVDR